MKDERRLYHLEVKWRNKTWPFYCHGEPPWTWPSLSLWPVPPPRSCRRPQPCGAERSGYTNAKFKLNLTKPRALKLLKIWGSGVDASIVEGVGFITGLKSMWYSLSVFEMYILDISGYLVVRVQLYPARRARALRALGLLLADGTPTGGRGEDFLSRQPDFFTETAVTPERKVEKSFPRWEINRHVEG